MGARVDIAIVGGGIIGVCAAYELAGEGRSVAVLEREDICAIGGATHSNAGLITPSDVYPLASPGALGKGMRWLLDSGSPFYIAPQARPRLGRWLWMFSRASTRERAAKAMPVQRALLRASADDSPVGRDRQRASALCADVEAQPDPGLGVGGPPAFAHRLRVATPAAIRGCRSPAASPTQAPTPAPTPADSADASSAFARAGRVASTEPRTTRPNPTAIAAVNDSLRTATPSSAATAGLK